MANDHLSAYQALVARGNRQKDKKYKDPYVVLYMPQPLGQNCALLYSPDATAYRKAPIHFHDWSIERKDVRGPWREDVFRALSPLLVFVKRDHEDKPRDSFSQFALKDGDWNRFLKVLFEIVPPATSQVSAAPPGAT